MSFTLLGILNSQAAGAGGAGSYDLLESEILATDTASVTFSNISTTYGTDYKHLELRLVLGGDGTSGNRDCIMVLNNNGSASAGNHKLSGNGSSVSSSFQTGNNFFYLDEVSGNGVNGVFTPMIISFLDFANTSKNTTYRQFKGASSSNQVNLSSGVLLSTAALDSINISLNTGNFETGSRFSLYGIKGA